MKRLLIAVFALGAGVAAANAVTYSSSPDAAPAAGAKAPPDPGRARNCRQEGRAKGLADKDLKAYVKHCGADAR
jgi:hypothetical protein